jgi:hypothetical protein
MSEQPFPELETVVEEVRVAVNRLNHALERAVVAGCDVRLRAHNERVEGRTETAPKITARLLKRLL